MRKFRTIIEKMPISFSGEYELLSFYQDDYNNYYVPKELTFKMLDSGMSVPESSKIRLNTTEVQELMDRLWGLGFRPSDMKAPEETLSATQNHLKDMRTIVFEHFLKGKKDA